MTKKIKKSANRSDLERRRQPERGTERNETKPKRMNLGLWKRQVLKSEPESPAPALGETESPGWERIEGGG